MRYEAIQSAIQRENFCLDQFGRVVFKNEFLLQEIDETKEFVFSSGADWNVACHNSRCG